MNIRFGFESPRCELILRNLDHTWMKNSRAEKDQSKSVKKGHWCGRMAMDEAGDSSTSQSEDG